MTHAEKLKDIKENPQNHRHYDLNGLHSCAMIDGALDLSVIAAHEGLLGYNGGEPCDVRSGPCSCGAFH